MKRTKEKKDQSHLPGSRQPETKGEAFVGRRQRRKYHRDACPAIRGVQYYRNGIAFKEERIKEIKKELFLAQTEQSNKSITKLQKELQVQLALVKTEKRLMRKYINQLPPRLHKKVRRYA